MKLSSARVGRLLTGAVLGVLAASLVAVAGPADSAYPVKLVTGTVRDQEGDPVAGTVVSGLYFSGSSWWPLARSAVSGADGRYALDLAGLSASTFKISFVPSTTHLPQWFEGADQADGGAIVTVNPGSTVAGVDAVLIGPAVVSGRVLTPEATAVAGATVTAFERDNGNWSAVASAATGIDGSYTLPMTQLDDATYRVGFTAPARVAQFWNNRTTLASADNLALSAGDDRGSVDAVLAVASPTPSPTSTQPSPTATQPTPTATTPSPTVSPTPVPKPTVSPHPTRGVVRLSPLRKSFRIGSRPVVTVSVAVPGTAAPKGRVKIYRGTVLVKKCSLKPARRGVLTVPLLRVSERPRTWRLRVTFIPRAIPGRTQTRLKSRVVPVRIASFSQS